jgi:methylenetetrahydrofolate dehydrogenase (NADP+)/methenyltetrahydrofolate cyclohydrolase
MPKILDGKIIRNEIIVKLKKEIEGFETKPTLAIIQIGDLAESNKYIKAKKTFAEKIGAEVRHVQFAETVLQDEVIVEIQRLNQDESVQGIILQLPIPKNLNSLEIIEMIDPEKDVDGLTLLTKFTPATARGVMALLDYYQIDVVDKKVTVMGRSKLVGGPIAKLLVSRGAIVSVVHHLTENPKEITKTADILIVAIGKPHLIDETYIKEGQVVVDVGITMEDDQMFGDVNFEKVKDIVSAISPVPGGVGPLTVASLFLNLVAAHKNMV